MACVWEGYVMDLKEKGKECEQKKNIEKNIKKYKQKITVIHLAYNTTPFNKYSLRTTG